MASDYGRFDWHKSKTPYLMQTGNKRGEAFYGIFIGRRRVKSLKGLSSPTEIRAAYRAYVRRWKQRQLQRAPNPKRLERCVRAVKRKGGAVNPWAVCNAQRRRRRRNPSRYPRASRADAAESANRALEQRLYVLVAKKPGQKELTFTGEKFASRGTPVYFRSKEHAATVARFLVLKHQVLRGWKFYAKDA